MWVLFVTKAMCDKCISDLNNYWNSLKIKKIISRYRGPTNGAGKKHYGTGTPDMGLVPFLTNQKAGIFTVECYM